MCRKRRSFPPDREGGREGGREREVHTPQSNLTSWLALTTTARTPNISLFPAIFDEDDSRVASYHFLHLDKELQISDGLTDTQNVGDDLFWDFTLFDPLCCTLAFASPQPLCDEKGFRTENGNCGPRNDHSFI